ncbi:Mob1/phocein [Coniella lustricola]|uniref:Mob1/phocein n=1 Tax=Coniella lustricola TaxID=2025994 RepID=A0A2T3A2W7_9PEZI|nr:Mob1/phocein [Coniella lustricola]
MAALSPRLPSPPPPAEIQLGPKSPGLGSTADQESQLMEQTLLYANAKRRIRPGTKNCELAAGPPLIPLSELDSAFQLQEHLAALHYHHTAHSTQPITRETALILATPPPSIDRNLWLYELCRFLIAQCNTLIVGFLFDTPPCSAQTCPEMRASEWQFLCSVHEQPKSCCAIDYCCHTLDWAANVVTNPKLFPSRLVAPSGGSGEGSGHDKSVAIKNLVNVFRRLHRIFAHAWFQHRGVFWSAEGQTGLYVFFKTVCDTYDTLPAENYKLPPEAEGLESAVAAAESMDRGGRKEHTLMPAPILLQRSEDENLHPPGRTNTRRHIRGSPSTGSAVTTVMEADEDESFDMTGRLGEMHISAPETVDEETESAEVPVIVEQNLIEELQPESEARTEKPTIQDEPEVGEEQMETETGKEKEEVDQEEEEKEEKDEEKAEHKSGIPTETESGDEPTEADELTSTDEPIPTTEVDEDAGKDEQPKEAETETEEAKTTEEETETEDTTAAITNHATSLSDTSINAFGADEKEDAPEPEPVPAADESAIVDVETEEAEAEALKDEPEKKTEKKKKKKKAKSDEDTKAAKEGDKKTEE